MFYRLHVNHRALFKEEAKDLLEAVTLLKNNKGPGSDDEF